MRRYVAAFLSVAALAFLATAHADAQTAFVGSACGNQGYVIGTQPPVVQTQAGTLCTNESGGSAPSPYAGTYLGNQTALTLASSTALTPTATATVADIVVEANTTYNQKIRCLADGTVPTTTTGLELAPGATWRVASTNLANVKCIQEASSAAIDVQYSK